MRKVLLLLLITNSIFASGLAGGKAYIENANFIIKSDNETTIKISDNTGFYLEFYMAPEQDVGADVALGLKYNSFIKSDDNQSVAYITTLYGVGRFEWDIPMIKPFFQVKAGYPYCLDGDYIESYDNASKTYYNDLKGESYFGAGIGVRVLFFDASINYEMSSYKLKSTQWIDEKKVSSSNVNLNIGFKF